MQRDFESMNDEAKADAYWEARAERRAQDGADDRERHGRVMTAFENPPIPIRAFDWSAWIDGQEEWLTGRGRTEAEAIADLWEQVEDREAYDAYKAAIKKPHASDCGIWTAVQECDCITGKVA